MKTYQLSGHYQYLGTRGELSGEVTVDGTVVEGEIIDHGSRAPRQKIRGTVKSIDGVTQLEFFKMPKDEQLANLVYSLEKQGTSIEGTYTGKWFAIPRTDTLRIETDVFKFISITRNPSYAGNEEAEITLK